MVENRPWHDFLAHTVLILGVIMVAFPLWVTFVASTLRYEDIVNVPMPMVPGDQFAENYSQVLKGERSATTRQSVSSVLVAS